MMTGLHFHDDESRFSQQQVEIFMMVGQDFSCLGLKPNTRKSAKSLYSSKICCSLFKFTILKNRRIVMKKNINTIIDAFRGILKPVC